MYVLPRFLKFELLKLIFFFDIGRKAAHSIRAVNRMATLAHVEHDPGRAQMREDIYKYKEESAKVCWSFSVTSFMRLIAFQETLEVCICYQPCK